MTAGTGQIVSAFAAGRTHLIFFVCSSGCIEVFEGRSLNQFKGYPIESDREVKNQFNPSSDTSNWVYLLSTAGVDSLSGRVNVPETG